MAGAALSFGSPQFTGASTPASINATLTSNAVPMFGTTVVSVTPQGGSLAGQLTLTRSGTLTTIAGSATAGCVNGTGAVAQFNGPGSIVIDGSGNLIVADQNCHSIRKVTPAGVVTTIGGALSTTGGFADGANAAAQFSYPSGLALDTNGDPYVADAGNNRIRLVTATTTSTFAGQATAGNANSTVGTNAYFSSPIGLAIDTAARVLYVANTNYNQVRSINLTTTATGDVAGSGFATTIDGTGPGNGGASFNKPTVMARDTAGNLYITDNGSNYIRKMTTPGAVVTTIAGSGTAAAVDGTGAAASFATPRQIGVDPVSGRVFERDTNVCTMRTIDPSNVVTSPLGVAGSCSLVDGPATSARLGASPGGQMAVDANGAIYFTDVNAIRSMR